MTVLKQKATNENRTLKVYSFFVSFYIELYSEDMASHISIADHIKTEILNVGK